ncbi:MAG: DNA primase DnaG [Desulfurococcaceae archaeon]
MAKYLIKTRIEVDGVVDKHDIVGAIFGQTEGLFGDYFELRSLQEKGRIGRIAVNTRVQNGKTIGEIIIPSNLDRVETALLIAMIENVERVGPYQCKIELVDIIDVRLEKIKKIIDRAVSILKKWSREKVPDIKEILKELQDKIKMPEPVNYGPDNLPAGPSVDESDTIIVVEGRADVINMLQYGYTNVIALGGARKPPDTLKNLAMRKKIILLVDGDHAGELVLREVLREMKVDYIARAPLNREVEELSGRELKEVLDKSIDTIEYLNKLIEQGDEDAKQLLSIQKKLREIGVEKKIEKPFVEKIEEIVESITIPGRVIEDIKNLYGTLEAILYNNEWNPVSKIPVRDLVTHLDTVDAEEIYAIVLDGIVTQRLINKAYDKKVKLIIGARIGKVNYKPFDLITLSFNDLI